MTKTLFIHNKSDALRSAARGQPFQVRLCVTGPSLVGNKVDAKVFLDMCNEISSEFPEAVIGFDVSSPITAYSYVNINAQRWDELQSKGWSEV